MGALKFKRGDTVRQVLPAPIEGVVLKQMIEKDDSIQVLVEWKEGEDLHRRWFLDSELNLKPKE